MFAFEILAQIGQQPFAFTFDERLRFDGSIIDALHLTERKADELVVHYARAQQTA